MRNGLSPRTTLGAVGSSAVFGPIREAGLQTCPQAVHAEGRGQRLGESHDVLLGLAGPSVVAWLPGGCHGCDHRIDGFGKWSASEISLTSTS
jgi:hypothetical protein